MTTRTVQISPYHSAQGDWMPPGCTDCPGWHVPRCDCSDYATVRTGPTTTATGRLVERMQR